MTSWLFRIIGIEAHPSATGSLHFHRIHWLWLGIALLLPLYGWIGARHRASLPQLSLRSTRLLTGCRVIMLFMLLVIMAGPYVALSQRDDRKPVVVVLIDDSASMTLPLSPAAPETSRQAAVQQSLGTHWPALAADLQERFDVHLYRFARSAMRVASLNEAQHESPENHGSAPGRAMMQAITAANGQPPAALVLITDGGWTSGPDPLEAIAQQPARAAPTGKATLPVFTVPVGDRAPLPDVALSDPLLARTIARGDVAPLFVMVRSTGLAHRAINVRLYEGDRVLDEQTITLSDHPQQVQFMLRETATAGDRELRVAVDAQPGERVTQNNEVKVRTTIRDQSLRVLHLEAAPRWDFRFIDHAIRRDRSVTSVTIMEDELRARGVAAADLPQAAKLPESSGRFAAYSLIMLGDISPDLLPPAHQEQLAKAVREEGVGLIVQAGMDSMPHRFAQGPLAQVLPVVLGTVRTAAEDGVKRKVVTGGIEALPFAPFQMEVTARGAIHPVFAWDVDTTRSRQRWNAMPPFHWAVAVAEVKPGATVLAQVRTSTGPLPLVVEHRVGRGRVLFVGTDSTYLWRREVGDRLFNHFWGQAMRHVARHKRSDSAIWIETQPAESEPDEPVLVTLHQRDGLTVAGDAQSPPVLEVLRYLSATGRVQLTPSAPDESGAVQAMWTPMEAGEYRIVARSGSAEAAHTHHVRQVNREFSQPQVNRTRLAELADRSGGAMLELDELHKLPSLLPVVSPVQATVREVDAWDNGLVLSLLIALYAMDIAIRRRSGVM